MIDASIPLQFKPNIEAPNLPNMFMQGQSLALQRQAAIQEQQLRAQQIQAGTLENQQRQYDLQDQQIMRQQLPSLLNDPANQDSNGNPDYTKIMPKLSTSGISPKALFNLQQMGLGIQKSTADIANTKATTGKTNQEVAEAKNDLIGRAALTVANANYDPTAAEGAMLHLETMFPDLKGNIDQYRAAFAQDPSTIKPITQYLIGQSGKATTEQREQTTANITNAKNQAETANTKASLPGIEADAANKQLALKMMQKVQADPSSLDAQIDNEILPNKYPAINKSTKVAAHAATNYEDMQKAIAQGLSDVRSQERSIATVQAEAPIREAEATSIAATNKKMEMAEQARREVVQSQDEVNRAMSVGETVKTLAAQAKAGNSTAASQLQVMIPELVNSVQGIKRLSGGQMENAPGSALDKLQATVRGITSGVKVSDREFDELPGVVDQLTDTARRAHNAGVDSRNQVYGTNMSKLDAPTKVFPSGQVHAYATAHGITDDAAKSAITQAGYKIQ